MHFQIKGDYFNGQFHLKSSKIPDSADEVIEKYCPADLADKLWEISTDFNNVDKVLESAVVGFKKWKLLSVEERMRYLKKYQENILIKKDEIALAISLETGKPLWEAKTEVTSVVNKVTVTIEHSLERIKEIKYSSILPDTDGRVLSKPLGPCLIIGPFNFPCHLANGQIVSALLAGNSIIFKPSEKTVYSGQLLVECLHQADFPIGVVNLINGGAETAKRLTAEPSIKGIYFTGSKEVGKKILEVTHKDLSKLVALELGGKNTTIIHEDASLDFALHEMLNSCFLTAGQRCTSTSIIAIHEKIKDNFISRFHELAKNIVIDHPIDYESEPFMGPLIDEKAVQNFLVFMGMGNRENAEEIMRAKILNNKKFKGHYVSPSIHYMEKPKTKSLFIESEIFGPSCTFISYNSIDDAIKISNSGEYGLAGSIFTADKGIYEHCVNELDLGILNWNRGTIGASPKLPFGGVKNSGNYRPASLTMVDACVFQMANLEVNDTSKIKQVPITGLTSSKSS